MHECAINRNENRLEDLVSKKSLIATIEKESGMNIPEWLRETIMNAPSAIVEVDDWVEDFFREYAEKYGGPKTGKWIPHKSIFGGLGEKVYTCDQCGYNIGFHTENFCPHCGADMRGEQDDT